MRSIHANVSAVQWLLEGDPAIRWQGLRDLRVLKWWERNSNT
jgi:hypothetical protein